MERFFRTLRLKTHLMSDRPEWAARAMVSNPGSFSDCVASLKPPSRYQPPHNHVEVETYIKKVKTDIQALNLNSSVSRRPNGLSTLQTLGKDRSIVIKKADKGSSIVIQDSFAYKGEIMSQLGDRDTYKPLSTDPLGNVQKELKAILDIGLNLGIITEVNYDFLLPSFPRTPVLYTLPKVHKAPINPPGRPIVSGSGSIFQPSAIFLDRLLRTFATSGKSYIKDTTQFLKLLLDFNHDLSSITLVTLDVKSLYTSIPHDMGMEAIRDVLSTSNYSGQEQEFILTLLNFVLTRNYFLFGDLFFEQTKGTAMGSNVAPTYAVIFMNIFEDRHVYQHPLYSRVRMYTRYIDDVFLLWSGDESELLDFITHLNSIIPSIQFSYQYSKKDISFLDVIVSIQDNHFSTDLFSKPTDKNAMLHFNSNHPRHVIRSLPLSQFMRVKRIVSDSSILEKRLMEMYTKFRKRGYPHNILQEHLRKIQNMSRISLLEPSAQRTNNKLDRIPFVSEFAPWSGQVKNILHKHWSILKHSFPEIFDKYPLMSYRKGKTSSSFLTRSDIGPTNISIQQTISDSPNPGTYPCLNCAQCHNITKGSFFTHPDTGRKYRIPGYFTCLSSYIVYLIKCPCGKAYVGQTTQRLKDRISHHKSSIRTSKTDLPVPAHFVAQGHQVNQLKVQVIDWVPRPRLGGNRSELLKRKELKWINVLNTIAPRGMNIEFDINSPT